MRALRCTAESAGSVALYQSISSGALVLRVHFCAGLAGSARLPRKDELPPSLSHIHTPLSIAACSNNTLKYFFFLLSLFSSFLKAIEKRRVFQCLNKYTDSLQLSAL